MRTPIVRTLFVVATVSLLAACGGAAGAPSAGPTQAVKPAVKLTLAAYSTPSEAYGKIIPLFADQWKSQTGQVVTFDATYQGSGAQSRAIIGGLEADAAALSLEGDISNIVKAGLITHDWQTAPNKGIVSDSIVALAVRHGNPKNIHDWADLAQPGLEILTPDPKTSGGAQWNILALYGAALRGRVTGVAAGDEAAATSFLSSVLKNVTALDKDARTSITNFETGVGDVAITYENEVLLGQQRGQDYELVIPHSTILIENPVAVVDTYVDKHGTREAAEAFLNFIFTKPAQEIFAQYGFRSSDPEVAQATAGQFPAVTDLFTIGEVFGGWSKAKPKYFGDDGVYNQAYAAAQGQ